MIKKTGSLIVLSLALAGCSSPPLTEKVDLEGMYKEGYELPEGGPFFADHVYALTKDGVDLRPDSGNRICLTIMDQDYFTREALDCKDAIGQSIAIQD